MVSQLPPIDIYIAAPHARVSASLASKRALMIEESSVKMCTELKPLLVIVEHVAGFFMHFKKGVLEIGAGVGKVGVCGPQ